MSTLFYPTSGYAIGGTGGGRTHAKNPEEMWGRCSERQARKNENRRRYSGGKVNDTCRAYRYYNPSEFDGEK
jgi:hypothetical protein